VGLKGEVFEADESIIGRSQDTRRHLLAFNLDGDRNNRKRA
jgi:hypothetical protein